MLAEAGWKEELLKLRTTLFLIGTGVDRPPPEPEDEQQAKNLERRSSDSRRQRRRHGRIKQPLRQQEQPQYHLRHQRQHQMRHQNLLHQQSNRTEGRACRRGHDKGPSKEGASTILDQQTNNSSHEAKGSRTAYRSKTQNTTTEYCGQAWIRFSSTSSDQETAGSAK